MKVGDLRFIAVWEDEEQNLRNPVPVLVTKIEDPIFDIKAIAGEHRYCLTPSQMYATLEECQGAIDNDCPAFGSKRSG